MEAQGRGHERAVEPGPDPSQHPTSRAGALNRGVTDLHLPLNFMLTVPKWVFQEREYHGVSKARKLSMVVDPHLVMPTDASLPGGCDRDSGLRKCLGKLRDVPHSHPLCPPLLGLARGTALARGLRGQAAASSPHLGVGLGQGHGAEPHKLLEGSTQTRPSLTHLTLWCRFLKAQRDKPQKIPPPRQCISETAPWSGWACQAPTPRALVLQGFSLPQPTSTGR